MEKEKAIWAELETVAPNSVADFKAATDAMDAQDYEKAATLFMAVNEKASDFDAALRRLGWCFVQTGKTDAGFAFMEQALAIRRTPENLITLAQSLANKARIVADEADGSQTFGSSRDVSVSRSIIQQLIRD